MSREFKFPDLGEGITEGELVKWLVSEGDSVKEDQDVAEVETDKALVTIPSPGSGTVEKLNFKEGDVIKVGEVLMVFGEGGEKESKEEPKEKKEEKAQQEDKQEDKEEEKEEKQEKERGKDEKEKEKEEEEEEKTDKKEEAEKEKKESGKKKELSKAPPLASPYTRKVARELGIDLTEVEGSGPGGRITEQDVRAFSKGGEKSTPAQPVSIAASRQEAPQEDFEKFGRIERVPLKGVRRKISDNMLLAQQQTVMVTHMDEAVVDELLKIRKEKAEYAASKNVKLTLLPFLMKACVIGMREFPYLNASLVDGEIILKKYYHFGFAVDTEAGLMVPVIRDVDKKSIMHLASELTELSAQARDRSIAVEAFQGHSFSITNIGSIGGKNFTPIINYPDSAILGIGRTHEKPIARKGKVSLAHVLPLCLTFDHRITDGATAARFVNKIIHYLADPDLLLLDDGED